MGSDDLATEVRELRARLYAAQDALGDIAEACGRKRSEDPAAVLSMVRDVVACRDALRVANERFAAGMERREREGV